MSEEKKKKNKIIGISIGILVVLLVVISSTYAYWQITKSQKDPNQIVAACLDFDVNFPVGITEENKWPMSGNEAMSTIDGYTFTVTNNCPEDVTYVIGLESVTSQGITDYLQDSSVGIGFDGVNKGTYNSLTDLEGPTANARGSKKLQTAIVKGKSDVEGENVNTHNLKLWIDETSDAEEQSKGFSAKLFITGGQKIENDMPNELTAESCFEMDGTEIIKYDESCGESVVIPATVDGVAVKSIDTDAFKGNITRNVYQEYSDDGFIQVDSLDTSQADFSYVGEDGAELPSYFIVYNNTTEIVGWIEEQIGEMVSDDSIEIYYAGTDDIPTLNPGDLQMFAEWTVEDLIPIGIKTVISEKKLVVTSLDLSQAYNLEKIEEVAFSTIPLTVGNSDGCSYTSIDLLNITDPSIITGLSSLTFGEQQNIKLGTGAFAGLKTDELTIYNNIEAYSECNNSQGFPIAQPFFYTNINNLVVKPINNNTIFSLSADSGAFFGSYINNINVNEGITELGDITFGLIHILETITLPNSLEKIGERTFGSGDVSDNLSITIPDNVNYIGKQAFWLWPSTTFINFTRTEEEVIQQVTFGEAWNNNAIVTYAQQ